MASELFQVVGHVTLQTECANAISKHDANSFNTVVSMPGAGTDKTKRWIETPAPIVVLVEPQLGENIGAAARAMANFGLPRLRLVKPLKGWPNEKARVMAAGADRILDGVVLYDTLEEAIGDCNFVLATTARNHDQAKPVISADAAAAEMAPRVAWGESVAIIFGRERIGLENHEIALADRIVTLPVNPAFASLNLAQAVVIVAYEWFKYAGGGAIAVFDAGKISAGREAAARCVLLRSRERAGTGRVFSSGGKARHHEREPAQHLPANGADPTGHSHVARGHQRDCSGAQRSCPRGRPRP